MVSFLMPKLIFVAVLSALISVSEQCHHQAHCPEAWEGFNGRCFKNFGLEKSWTDAEGHCVEQGGHLASVHSIEEQRFIRKINKDSDPSDPQYWIGLTDVQQEGAWMWSDGSEVDFTYWYADQPDNYGKQEHCVHAYWGAEKQWNDIPCSNQFRFICAKYPEAAPQ